MEYEIKAILGRNLKYSLKELRHQILYDFNIEISFDEILENIKNNKIIFLYSIEQLLNKILFKRGDIVITKDNVHLYYEFMLPGQKLKYHKILNDLFNNRLDSLSKELNINKKELLEFCTMDAKVINDIEVFYISLCCFKTKDTLKSIGEYKEEIKASSEYKEYKKTLLTNEEKRAYRTGEIPNSPNYAKRCRSERLRSR